MGRHSEMPCPFCGTTTTAADITDHMDRCPEYEDPITAMVQEESL